MNKKFLLFVIFLALLLVVFSKSVMINLRYENDNILNHEIRIINSKTNYLNNVELFTHNYEVFDIKDDIVEEGTIRFLSENELILYNFGEHTSIDNNMIIYFNYLSTLKEVKIFKEELEVYNIDLMNYNLCNLNDICEDNENLINCKDDCKNSDKDGLCFNVEDGLCDNDPDCKGLDPDCLIESGSLSTKSVELDKDIEDLKANDLINQENDGGIVLTKKNVEPIQIYLIMLIVLIIIISLVFIFIKKQKNNF